MSWRSTSLRLGGWRSRWPDSPWRSDPQGKWSLQHAAGRENATAPLGLLPSLRLGDQVPEAAVGVVADRLVQRHLPAGGHHRQRLQDLLLAQLQLLGQFEGGGGAALALEQLVDR